MRAAVALVAAVALAAGAPALAGGAAERAPAAAPDRIEELQQELDSLAEDVEDLEEPVAEFTLFEECMYLIGVTEYGRADGAGGYAFRRGGTTRRRALAFDMRGFGRATYQLLGFPAEEPPSIECNEDAGEEDSDD